MLIIGWSLGAWLEGQRERRRLGSGDPAPTTDRSGWRTVLGFPLGQSPEETARLRALEEKAYEAIHEHHDDRRDDDKRP